MISVVIPTILGRQHLLDATIEAFQATSTTQIEFIIPRGHPTCGEAWNAGAERANGEFLMLAADDMIPHDGWAAAAIEAADNDVYPAPWILNPDGSTLCCGTLGSGLLLTDDARDGLPVTNSPVPFMARELWEMIGPTIPAHCYSDDYLAYRARIAGLDVEFRRGFKFTHLDGQPGHAPVVSRSGLDRALYAREASRL